jgi:hypothetical protein
MMVIESYRDRLVWFTSNILIELERTDQKQDQKNGPAKEKWENMM